MSEPLSTLLLPHAVSGSMNFWQAPLSARQSHRPSISQGPVGQSGSSGPAGQGVALMSGDKWPGECTLWKSEIAAVP